MASREGLNTLKELWSSAFNPFLVLSKQQLSNLSELGRSFAKPYLSTTRHFETFFSITLQTVNTLRKHYAQKKYIKSIFR